MQKRSLPTPEERRAKAERDIEWASDGFPMIAALAADLEDRRRQGEISQEEYGLKLVEIAQCGQDASDAWAAGMGTLNPTLAALTAHDD